MGFIVVALFICIGFYCLSIKAKSDNEKQVKKLTEEFKEEGLEFLASYVFRCLGGFKDMGACEECYICVCRDRLRITLIKKENGVTLGSKVADVLISDITDIALENERSIVEKVSLGKLMVFGLLSFGMQGKQKEVNRELLVLTFNYNNEEVSLILTEYYKNTNTKFNFLQYVNSLRSNENEALITEKQA